MGIERIILALTESNSLPELTSAPDVYIANIGEGTETFVAGLAASLRKSGVHCEQDLCGRSLKAQMKYADKCNCRYSIVIGESEIEDKKASLKNMTTKEETIVSLSNLEEIVNAVKEAK